MVYFRGRINGINGSVVGDKMITYEKLWHKLLDNGINRTELCNRTGISSSTMAKLGKNEIVSLEVLEKICRTLDCNIGDVAEFKWEQE